MPTATDLKGILFRSSGWAGGANLRDDVLMQPNEVNPIENVIIDERGGARKRLGCESKGTFGVEADRVLAMYTFNRGRATQPQVLIHTTAGTLYYTNDPSAAAITWTQITTGLSTSVPLTFETFSNKVYFGNGVDSYASWNGTGYATYPSAPKGRYHRVWQDTMWISGVTGQDDRVYSSDPGNAETFPVAGYIDIGKGDGDHVRALVSDGQFLVVGKRLRTYTIYDPVNFYNRVVDFEKGFESHTAVIQFDGDIYFLSRRGFCQYLGDSPSRVISDKLDPLFSPDTLTLDMLGQASCYAYENRVGFAVPEAGSQRNSVVIEYYPRLSALTSFGSRSVGPFSFQRMPTQCFARWRWQTKDILVAGHTVANKILHVFAKVGTDDGVPFQGVIQTGFFDMGNPALTKYLREVRLVCSGTFNLHIYRNYSTKIYKTISIETITGQDVWNTDEFWGTGEWQGAGEFLQDIRKTNVDAYGRYFSFRFSDSNETETGIDEVLIGSNREQLTVGEWSIFSLVVEGTVLGKRS